MRRLATTIPILLGISVVSFAIIHFAPGDPALTLADPRLLTSDQVAAIHKDLGLDEPLPAQYVKTIYALLSGDLRSYQTRQTVYDLLAVRLPTTLLLGSLALTLGFAFGIAIGVLQALRPYSRLDDAGTFLALFGFSTPEFWLALVLILFFAVHLGWLPAGGIAPAGESGWNPLSVLPHLVLPTVVLATGRLAGVARYARSSMLETLGQDYMRTARAKGLPERKVMVRHALRNSLLPVITLFGLDLPHLIGGAVVVETVFALPGVGRLALESVLSRDYPVILSINMMGAVAVILGNLLADIGYTVADPRIRQS